MMMIDQQSRASASPTGPAHNHSGEEISMYTASRLIDGDYTDSDGNAISAEEYFSNIMVATGRRLAYRDSQGQTPGHPGYSLAVQTLQRAKACLAQCARERIMVLAELPPRPEKKKSA